MYLNFVKILIISTLGELKINKNNKASTPSELEISKKLTKSTLSELKNVKVKWC